MGVEPKLGVYKTPKMDGLFHGKPELKMDDLGVKPPRIFGSTPVSGLNPLEHCHIFEPPEKKALNASF